jgi:CheY-like chemotaxis protein
MIIALELQGYEVSTVNTSTEALQAACAEKPALIILDLSTHRLGGAETIRKLRELPECRGIPILATSTYAPNAAAEAIRAGAQRAILKPIHSATLLALTDNLLK